MRGGKAPMVLISAVHGACCVGGRGTGLATPVAGFWLSGLWDVGLGCLIMSMWCTGSISSFCSTLACSAEAWRGDRVPEDTLRFSGSFHSTSF